MTAKRPHPAIAVDGWNQQHEIGAPVVYRNDSHELLFTTTRSRADILGGHTAVIWLVGVAGCVALDRVTAIPAPAGCAQ